MLVTDPPREGLPSCVKSIAIGDGRLAVWSLICSHPDHWAEVLKHFDSREDAIKNTPQTPHLVRIAETRDGVVTWASLPLPRVREGTRRILMAGDDPDEAGAAWERAECWVRTGEL